MDELIQQKLWNASTSKMGAYTWTFIYRLLDLNIIFLHFIYERYMLTVYLLSYIYSLKQSSGDT